MKIIRDNKRKLPNFLVCNGKSNSAVYKIITNAITGRNKVSHNELSQIIYNWEIFVDAWIDTSLLINDLKVAAELKRIRPFLRRNLNTKRRIPNTPPSDISALHIFRKLKSSLAQTNKWSNKAKEQAAIYLGDRLYDIIIDEYSPALNEYLTANNFQAPTSIIDCWAQTDIIIGKCSPSDFKTPVDMPSFDMHHLKMAVDGRHASIHEQQSNILLHWDSSMSSMIYVSKGIGANRAETRIAKVRAKLIAFKNRAMREIKCHRMRVQSKFIKAKKLRTYIRWLKRINPTKTFKPRIGGRRN